MNAKSKGKKVVARFKGIDDLGEEKGRLTRAFDNAILGTLYKAFSAAATDKTAAAQAVELFRKAALELRNSQTAFNKRAQRVGNSIMNHLPNPKQFAAMRKFHAAKEAMFDHNRKDGNTIARMFARGAGSAASQQPRPPSPQ